MLNHLSTQQVKRRLIWTRLCCCLIPLVALFLCSLFLDHKYFGSVFLVGFFNSIDFFIIYHCAFKKRGTRWLTVSIWCYILAFGAYALSLGCSLLSIVIAPETFLFLFIGNLINLVVLLPLVRVFKCCFVLRQRNNLYQYKNTLKSNDYRKAYTQIDESTSKKALDSTRYRLCYEFPELEKFLLFKYKRKKRLLMEPRT